MSKLDPKAVAFFFEYFTGPTQGRIIAALDCAYAEHKGICKGWYVTWEHDGESHVTEPEPETCEVATLFDGTGQRAQFTMLHL